ncbi:MAG TPA: hypothetical protein VFW22_09115 [Pseudolabrys sp.]|nr:hypothetical protein [Pseudolabrys sp.]
MSNSTIDNARGFSILDITPKNARVVKPVRSRQDDEADGEAPKRRPQPGTGELVDKTA